MWLHDAHKISAEKLLKLKELRVMFQKSRRTIRVGNAIGVTLPKEFVGKVGKIVTIIPIDERTLKLKVG